MYACDSDVKRIEKMSAIKASQEWLDYANFNPDGNWDWWKRKTGNTPLRTRRLRQRIRFTWRGALYRLRTCNKNRLIYRVIQPE